MRSMLAASLALSAVAIFWAQPTTAKPYLDRTLSKRETVRHLWQLREKVQHLAQRGSSRPVVVFDIDDTLIRKGHDGKLKAKHNAARYVQLLADAGAKVVYLTARPEYKKEKTVELLRTFGFPVASDQRFLFNPNLRDDAAWKRSAKPMIERLGTPTAFFDNDYQHVRDFRQQYPTAHVFRLNTKSARPDPGGKGLFEVIKHYHLEE